MRKVGIFKVLAVIQLAELVRGSEKRWLAEVDWHSPSNWLGPPPEDGSQLVFPMGMRHAVGMPRHGDFAFAALRLSNDGMLALPETGKIALMDEIGREARWLRDGPFLWVDPLNWNASSRAVPHLERVPCQDDVVVLPAGTFSVQLPMSRDVEVRAVRLADENASLARWEWRRLLGEGAEFAGSRLSVKYSPLTESAPGSIHRCQEGDLATYWEEVCDVQRPRCGPPRCERPLKVEGHCCHYCGGRLRLSATSLPGRARRAARTVWARHEAELDWHWRRTWDGQSEILVAEKSQYVGAATLFAVADLAAALRDEGLEVMWSETSGAPLSDYRLSMALAPLLGSLLVLLLAVLLVCPRFGYSYSQLWEACYECAAAVHFKTRENSRRKKSFAFARFENVSEGNVQLTNKEETGLHSVNIGTFENPLYSSQSASEKVGKAEEIKLDPNLPVRLTALRQEADYEQTEEIDIDIEDS